MIPAFDTDVLVVGGGPIGLAAAIRAREAGHRTIVVDRRSDPIDKACGEGLLPGALAALQALGVDPPGHPLAGISYRDASRHADRTFHTGVGRGVRRTILHAAMRARALELGVDLRRAGVTRVEITAAGVSAAGLSARWLLACDGLHSTVRRHTGLDSRGRAPVRFGLRQHYRLAPWTDMVEVHWGRRVEAYVTPVAPDLVGVAMLGPLGMRFPAALAEVPELAARLAQAPVAGPLLGAGPLRQRSCRRTCGPIRLVGDAAGYVDALTGEGLRVGFAQAAAAIRHLDDPSSYERAWRQATRDYRLLTSGLVRWAASPARPAIVPLAVALPGVYGTIVNRFAR